MGSVKHTTEKALQMMRSLPRVSLGNIRDNPNSKQNVRKLISKIVAFNLHINRDLYRTKEDEHNTAATNMVPVTKVRVSVRISFVSATKPATIHFTYDSHTNRTIRDISKLERFNFQIILIKI